MGWVAGVSHRSFDAGRLPWWRREPHRVLFCFRYSNRRGSGADTRGCCFFRREGGQVYHDGRQWELPAYAAPGRKHHFRP